MKLKIDIIDQEALEAVTPDEMARYLKLRGWESLHRAMVNRYGAEVNVWTRNRNRLVQVPTSQECRRYHTYVVKFLQAMCLFEKHRDQLIVYCNVRSIPAVKVIVENGCVYAVETIAPFMVEVEDHDAEKEDASAEL